MLLKKSAWLGEEGPRSQRIDSPRPELLNLALDLENRGQIPLAAKAYAKLQGSEQARERLAAMTGIAGFNLARGQFLAHRFLDQVIDPAALFSMLGAQGTYRILNPLLGKLPAFVAEASLFPVYHRLGDAGLGRRVDWSREPLLHDIQSSFLVLGGLKAFGYLGQRGLAWWKRGRSLQGDLLDQTLTRLLPASAMYLGILSGHAGEQAFGLAPSQSSGQLATESLVTLTHFLGVGRLLNQLSQIQPGPVHKIEGRFNWLPNFRFPERVGVGNPQGIVLGGASPANPARGAEANGRGRFSKPLGPNRGGDPFKPINFMKGPGESGFTAPTLWGKSIVNDFLRRKGRAVLRFKTFPEFLEAMDEELRMDFIRELHIKVLDAQTGLASQLPGTILETFRRLSAEDKAEIALEWASELPDIYHKTNYAMALEIWEQMHSQLNPPQRTDLARSIMDSLTREILRLHRHWERLIPALSSLALNLENAERAHLAKGLIQLGQEVAYSAEMKMAVAKFLEKILPQMDAEGRLETLWRLWTRSEGDRVPPDVEILKEEKPTLLRSIRNAIQPSDWSALTIRLARSQFYSLAQDPLESPKFLLGEVPFPDNRARLKLMGKVFEELGFTEGALDVADFILASIPPEQFNALATEIGDQNLQALAYLQSRGLPLDPYLLSEWRGAPDPDAYLKRVRAEVAEYRRGKNFGGTSEHELRLAYWGLDRPAGLSFEKFVKELDTDTELPPPFLNRPFKARVRLAPSTHALVNQTKIREALAHVNAVRYDGTFRSYLMDLEENQARHLRKIQWVWDEAFPRNLADATKGRLLSGSKILLKALLAQGENYTFQSVAGRLALYLAWNNEVPPPLQDRIRSLNQEGLTTEQYLEGVRALEEFYRDGLGQLENRLGLPMDQIPHIRRMRRNLAEELASVPVSLGGPTTEVEFIPSKNPADPFFSYVSEDFNLKKGGALQRPSFQLYRMVSEDSRLRGLIYLQQAVMDGKKALVMAVQPRRDWEVDQVSLIQSLQRELGLIAAKEGYDYLLMTKHQGTQSSRRDMLDAISGRRFPLLKFDRGLDHTAGPPVPGERVGPPSQYLFLENRFRVLWGRGRGPKARGRRP